MDLEPRYWNDKSNQVRSSHPQFSSINNRLNYYVTTLAEIIKVNGYDDIKQIKAHLDQHGFELESVNYQRTLDFIDYEMERRNYDNMRSFGTMRSWIELFDPNIKLNEWTKLKAEQYHQFLRSQPTLNSENTISRYLADLRTLLNRAIFLELIKHEQNPFNRGFKIKSYRAKDVKLQPDEFSKLYELVETHEGARFFMLMFYLDGARPNEALKLTWSDVSAGLVKYQQSKTGKWVYITMTDKLQYILSLYPKSLGYIVPQMNASSQSDIKRKVASSLTLMNRALKVACKDAQVPPMTCHTARHTFAYFADESGYTLIELQHALNHSKPEITASYIGALREDRMANKRKQLHDRF